MTKMLLRTHNQAECPSSLHSLFLLCDWLSECRGPLNYYGNDIQVAVLLGRVLSQHVNYLKVTAWFLWQAIQQRNGGGWGCRCP